eukprot:TRINITY_DN2719_c0_g1_i1.p1 TRINITY_DN2719_c0_g1~~TRINITY_DN2719_c0_g1_i1.p1  ORF type:complete len:680 (+),score=141.53 TRINITY_DN2719_c0_g1_i1:47-2041(+)
MAEEAVILQPRRSVLKQSRGPVTGCCWSQNSRKFACVSYSSKRIDPTTADPLIEIFDARNILNSRRVIATCVGHKGLVSQIKFAPDSSLLASTGRDDFTAKIWDADTGVKIRTLKRHNVAVNACDWDADGSQIVTASDDKTCRIWSSAGKTVRILIGHIEPVVGVSWSPDGSRVLTCSDDTLLKLYDPATGEKLRTFRGHSGRVPSCDWSPDSQCVVSAGADGRLIIWNPKNAEQLQTLVDSSFPSLAHVKWSPSGRFIATSSMSGSICIWDILTNAVAFKLVGHSAKVNALAWSPDGTMLMSAGEDGNLFLWSLNQFMETRNLEEESTKGKVISNKRPAKSGSKKVLLEDEEEESENVPESLGVEAKEPFGSGSTIMTGSIADPTKKPNVEPISILKPDFHEVDKIVSEEEEIIRVTTNSSSNSNIHSSGSVKVKKSVIVVADEKEEPNQSLQGQRLRMDSVFKLEETPNRNARALTAQDLEEELQILNTEQKANTNHLQNLVEQSESLASDLATNEEELKITQRKLNAFEDAIKSLIFALARVLLGLFCAQFVHDLLFNLFGFVTTYPVLIAGVYYGTQRIGDGRLRKPVFDVMVALLTNKPLAVLISFVIFFALPMFEGGYFFHRLCTDVLVFGVVLLEVKDSSKLISLVFDLLQSKEKRS